MTNRYDPSDLNVYGAEDDEDTDNILEALEKATGDGPSVESAPGERT